MLNSITIPLASTGHLNVLDWVTLVAYALLMLGIGWYFAVRTKSVDDFMLGGRSMNPWFVGLSMFVTYMSILTYLALPGEMVGKGPMVLGNLISFPIAFAIGAIWIIPYIMRRNKVVSAYELVEERFGTGMRMLASAIFLVQRFIWMGVIVFAVVDKILIPVFDIPPEWLPYICVCLGLFTAIYSTMGGLKAVVVTDVIQSLILLAGAIISIVYLVWLTTGHGISFWPETWHAHWPQENIWFGDFRSRITIFDAFLGMLVWYVATIGSDQMAVQRYLSMGSVSKARKMLGVAIGANGFVIILLGVVGLGLLAYYTNHTNLLPNDGDLSYISGKNADSLFPHFILTKLPAGLSGLLIAAILAAAMSSLSSGINSSSSVVLVDFVERLFGHHAATPKQRVLYARIISMAIGLAVIGLSIWVANIEKNLWEICCRLINLLVGPLFVTFCLAIFIPWASRIGVWIATIVSLLVALFIAYPKLFFVQNVEIGFNWIIVLSLVGGVAVGMIVSLVFPDKKRPEPQK
ncbi:MAG: hypothetical protein PVH19_08110 [Planctomycetia bacterium]|jgi:SSS family solute:Na+ symporter